MAECLFNTSPKRKSELPDYYAESAGIYCSDDNAATDVAIEVMNDIEKDITAHRTRKITQEIYDSADIIVPLTREHEEKIKSMFKGDKRLQMAE